MKTNSAATVVNQTTIVKTTVVAIFAIEDETCCPRSPGRFVVPE
jgi:hypothetical protein